MSEMDGGGDAEAHVHGPEPEYMAVGNVDDFLHQLYKYYEAGES